MHRRLPDIVARLDVRTNESQTRMEESRLRIAGASDTPDPTTQARIARTLDKTRRGGLPAPFEAKLYAGPGSLAACDGCGDKIASEEREGEIEPAVAFTF
jgi:hypothetical protein